MSEKSLSSILPEAIEDLDSLITLGKLENIPFI